MSAIDVKCPICEKLNKSLNLEETDGWMECENCGNAVQILKYAKTRRQCCKIGRSTLGIAQTVKQKYVG